MQQTSKPPERIDKDDEAERRRDLIVEASQLDSPSRARAFSREENLVDWFLVIVGLERHGYTHRTIAMAIGNSKGAVGVWRCTDVQPNHASGEALISLWMATTGNDRGTLPLRTVTQLSAARVK